MRKQRKHHSIVIQFRDIDHLLWGVVNQVKRNLVVVQKALTTQQCNQKRLTQLESAIQLFQLRHPLCSRPSRFHHSAATKTKGMTHSSRQLSSPQHLLNAPSEHTTEHLSTVERIPQLRRSIPRCNIKANNRDTETKTCCQPKM